jgi:hypothetical protein
VPSPLFLVTIKAIIHRLMAATHILPTRLIIWLQTCYHHKDSNNNRLLYSYNFNPVKNTHLRHVTVHYFSRIVQPEAVCFPYWTSNTFFFFVLYIIYPVLHNYYTAWFSLVRLFFPLLSLAKLFICAKI